MKKRYLAYSGIAAAAILVIMFIGILATGSFTIFPAAAIDPIPDHAAGDLVVITGTTNYPAGTRLILDILAVSPAPGARAAAGATDAYIVRGEGMKNTWSGALDTAVIPPGEYQVNAYWVDESDVTNRERSSLLATSRMRLINSSPDTKLRPPLSNHVLTFININLPGTICRGEKILVSGTTNLPENTELIYLVIQQTNTSVFTIDPKTGRQDLKGGFTRSGLIDVLPGENGVGRWSFAFDSTEAIPGDYVVLVTLSGIIPENLGREGPFGSKPLVILEAASDNLKAAVPDTGPCQSITIDTVPERVTSRNMSVSGTTSLQPGMELRFQVLPAEFDIYVNPGEPGMSSGPMTGAVGTTNVVRGAKDTNTWSVDLDFSKFAPGKYLINVSNDRLDPAAMSTIYGDRYCTQKFSIEELSS